LNVFWMSGIGLNAWMFQCWIYVRISCLKDFIIVYLSIWIFESSNRRWHHPPRWRTALHIWMLLNVWMFESARMLTIYLVRLLGCWTFQSLNLPTFKCLNLWIFEQQEVTSSPSLADGKVMAPLWMQVGLKIWNNRFIYLYIYIYIHCLSIAAKVS
jgi:hypothetical protein